MNIEMREIGYRERILEAAERRARVGGYNGFSFRDLADDVGIKSSSVHYHFATKEALAAALAHRYTDSARQRLGAVEEVGAGEAVSRVVALFKAALSVEGRMCLCGLLGAERDLLPPAVEEAVAGFFRMILDYLAMAFRSESNAPNPVAILANLEGGLMLARAMRDPSLFEVALNGIGQMDHFERGPV